MNANRKPRPSFRAAISLALLAALLVLVAGLVQALPRNIETWNDGQQYLVVNSSTRTASESISTTSALGEERDLYLQYLSGSGGDIICRVDYENSNVFSFAAEPGMMGQATLQWDGNDNLPITLTHQGLANVDLTDGGTNDGIWLSVLFEDLRGILRLEVYEDIPTLTWSYANVNLPVLSPGTKMDIFVPFTRTGGFVAGGGGGADFTNVGAVVMKVLGNVEAGLDVTIDFCESNSVREYGDLPVATPPNGYGTNVLNANHIPRGLRLGYNLDAEAIYSSTIPANGDDGSSAPDDEDGVTYDLAYWDFISNTGEVYVTVQGCLGSFPNYCRVNGWIDWNSDGDFADALEQIIPSDSRQGNGTAIYSFQIPDPLASGYYYARFRICDAASQCNNTTATNVPNGEVEDYRWYIGPTAVKLTSFSAAPAGPAILVEWETASEQDNAGFNLYRSVSVDTLGEQLNQALIPSAAPGGGSGASYTFLDAAAASGQTYYYTLEDVDLNGTRTRHGPVVATVPYAIFLPLVVR